MDWLTARPIAHRGLHDAANGVIENTASAVSAAIAAGYGIEVDLQPSADDEVMVFHDAVLDRLTQARGRVQDFTAGALGRIAFHAGGDRIMRLAELLDLAGGRAPLVLELKSRWDGDVSLTLRTAALLRGYAGPVAVMSFDPRLVAAMAQALPGIARGLVIQWRPDDRKARTERNRQPGLAALALHGLRARPHFMAWRLQDLSSMSAIATRRLMGLPLLTWTVRSESDHRLALHHADQVIFEGFRPLIEQPADQT